MVWYDVVIGCGVLCYVMVWFMIKIWIACAEVCEEYDVEEVYVCDFCK